MKDKITIEEYNRILAKDKMDVISIIKYLLFILILFLFAISSAVSLLYKPV